MAKRSRVTRLVLAVLSSVFLTGMVVVPLALGAHNARNHATTVAEVPESSTTPTTREPATSTTPEPTTAASVLPDVGIQVLPRTETRPDPGEEGQVAVDSLAGDTDDPGGVVGSTGPGDPRDG